MQVKIVIEVDEDFVDESDDTGMTEEGYLALSDAIMSVGSIAYGPDRVS